MPQFLAQFFKSFASAITTFIRAPGAARVGMILFFAAAVADGILMPFFALWAHKVASIPIAFIGLLLGCYAGGELLATPFVGGIADRVGRRPVLLVSTCGVGCGPWRWRRRSLSSACSRACCTRRPRP